MSSEQWTMPPGPRELLAVWEDWSAGDVHRRAAAKAAVSGDAAGAELLAGHGDRAARATPLQALAAAAELVRRMEGLRWLAMRDARESGATWQAIGDAIGLTRQRALGIYTEALERQERHVSDLHAPHAAAGRAAAIDDPPTDVEPTWPGAEVSDPRGSRWRRLDDGLWQDAHGNLPSRPWQTLWDVYGPLTPAPRVDAGDDVNVELRESNRRQAATFDAAETAIDTALDAYDATYGAPGSPQARGIGPLALRGAADALEIDPDDPDPLVLVGAVPALITYDPAHSPTQVTAECGSYSGRFTGRGVAVLVGADLADELGVRTDARPTTIADLPAPLRPAAAAAWAQQAETAQPTTET